MAALQKEKDIAMMLAAKVHQGTKNADYQMERYIFRRRKDGINIINLAKTWEKLHLAARIIVAIENPADVVVLSARPYGQRAVYKFGHYTGAKYMAGRHTPGTFNYVVDKSLRIETFHTFWSLNLIMSGANQTALKVVVMQLC